MRRGVLAAAGWVGAAAVAALVGLLALTLLRGGVGGGDTHAVSQQAAAQALSRAQQESANDTPQSAPPTGTAPGASSDPSRSSRSPDAGGSSGTGRPPAGSGTPTSTASASPTPTPSPTRSGSSHSGDAPGRARAGSGAVTRALDGVGGTVVARCEGDRVQLLSWTPRQGFEADDATEASTRTAYVKFESDDVDVQVTVDCRGGTPVAHPVSERDD